MRVVCGVWYIISRYAAVSGVSNDGKWFHDIIYV